jgi:hypothetical protein
MKQMPSVSPDEQTSKVLCFQESSSKKKGKKPPLQIIFGPWKKSEVVVGHIYHI